MFLSAAGLLLFQVPRYPNIQRTIPGDRSRLSHDTETQTCLDCCGITGSGVSETHHAEIELRSISIVDCGWFNSRSERWNCCRRGAQRGKRAEKSQELLASRVSFHLIYCCRYHPRPCRQCWRWFWRCCRFCWIFPVQRLQRLLRSTPRTTID